MLVREGTWCMSALLRSYSHAMKLCLFCSHKTAVSLKSCHSCLSASMEGRGVYRVCALMMGNFYTCLLVDGQLVYEAVSRRASR